MVGEVGKSTMARRTKEEAMETRERILEAALELLSEKGYDRTTFVDIADRIGLTKGAVYWHFASKQELFLALIRFFTERRERLVEAQAVPLDCWEHIQPHFVERSRVIMLDPVCRKFAYFLSFQMEWTDELHAGVEDVLRELRKDLFVQLLEVFTRAKTDGVLRSDIAPREACLMIISLWKGLFANDVGQYARMDLPRCVAVGIDVLLQGLRGDVPAVARKE